MIRLPPRSTRTHHSFPTRRCSYLGAGGSRGLGHRSFVGMCEVVGEPERHQRKHDAPGCGDGVSIVGASGRGIDEINGVHCEEADDRSEEHTSELKSLMRISYAVFCLKKKTYTNKQRGHYEY